MGGERRKEPKAKLIITKSITEKSKIKSAYIKQQRLKSQL